MAANKFACDYARLGTSGCKKCKQKLEKASLRLAKVAPNPFNDGEGEMKQYFHAKCLFETFAKARSTTKIIEESDDIEGFGDLRQEDQDAVNQLIRDLVKARGTPKKQSTSSKKRKREDVGDDDDNDSPKKKSIKLDLSNTPSSSKAEKNTGKAVKKQTITDELNKSADVDDDEETIKARERDNSFREFRKLCCHIAAETKHTMKTAVVAKYLRNGTNGVSFHGDVYLLLKFLLPGVAKTIYNLQDKQLVKIFSQMFDTSQEKMSEHVEQGDVSDTVYTFFAEQNKITPQNKSNLSLHEVNELLDELSTYTKEDEQQKCLTKIAKRCTANDLKMIVRLIKHDIKINCGSKLISKSGERRREKLKGSNCDPRQEVLSLDGLDDKAYEAFKASRDLKAVVETVLKSRVRDEKIKVKADLMTPVQPMLAEACKSVEQAFKKCPNGMFAEIKYDGERVQLHKNGNHFQYFSRSLKPVMDHKVKHFKDYIPRAFPSGSSLILDSEVLLIDTKTSKPLPFGTLGVHKKAAFKDANVCLFVFDCLHYNGENLMKKPIKERKEILKKVMVEIPNHVMLSEMTHINVEKDLVDLMMKAFKEGLEGLVLKDVNSMYEPGMRHWLKVKKDYLAQGSMADSADLVVLGAYFGTGSKGGMKSVFLMGAFDASSGKWCTVTKCGSGLSDDELKKLQTSIDMKKISKDYSQVPAWLKVSKSLVPDFVVVDPKKSLVWEIMGTEFTKSEVHTAGGISIRFPRILKIRTDKSFKEATDVDRLKILYETSKEHSKIEDLFSKNSPSSKGSKKDLKSNSNKNNKSTKKKEDEEEEDEDDADCKLNESTDLNESGEVNKSGQSNDDVTVTSELDSTQKYEMDEDDDELIRQVNLSSFTNMKEKEQRQTCRYGDKCYQKSFLHRMNFSHPRKRKSDESGTSTDDRGGNKQIKLQPLKDIFLDLSFYLSPSLAGSLMKKLKRYIVAYGGEVSDDYNAQDVDFCIADSPQQPGKIHQSSGYLQMSTSSASTTSIKSKKIITSGVIWKHIESETILEKPA